jgi:hypothetical protein
MNGEKEVHEYTVVELSPDRHVLLCTKCINAMWIHVNYEIPFNCGGDSSYEG